MAIAPIVRSLLRSPAGAILITLQIALTLAIVSNSMFIIQDRITKMSRPSGMPEEQILAARILYFGKNIDYAAQADRDLQFLLRQPGVINATQTNSVPLGGSGSSSSLCRAQPNNDPDNCPYTVGVYMGGRHLLDTLGLKLVAGRNFLPEEVTVSDFTGARAARLIILSQAVADSYFADQNAIGKTVYLGGRAHTVIGIVEHMQSPWVAGSEEQAAMTALLPAISHGFWTHLVIRAEADSIAALQRDLERDLLQLNDRRVVNRIETIDDMRQRVYANDRAVLIILLSVIVLLVLITALGTGGLVSFSVARRQKQIGTRRALGARKIDILGHFLLENGLISGAGAALGCALAIALNQYLMNTYELPRIGVEYIAAAALLLLLIGQSASYFPALRASGVSPAVATRTV